MGIGAYAKPSLVVTRTDAARVELQPVVVSIELTPEQRGIIARTTGQSPARIELTANELKVILTPGVFMNLR